jgi:hypothetical protein
MASTKITKSQRFEDIVSLLHGEAVKYGTTIEDADAFIAHEVELLTRKNSAERKETDTQRANAKYRDLIVEYLAVAESAKTCTEIAKGISELSDFNNQKVASLMRQLVEAGKVTKATVKGKSLFSLA